VEAGARVATEDSQRPEACPLLAVPAGAGQDKIKPYPGHTDHHDDQLPGDIRAGGMIRRSR
jgi:hypothetical protein